MSNELKKCDCENGNGKVKVQGGGSDTFYGLGLIGAWVYYIGGATTPEEKIKGFFKGLVWPAFLVYELFKFLERSNPTETEITEM